MNQWEILDYLKKNKVKTFFQADLIKNIGGSRSSFSCKIAKLVKFGYLKKKPINNILNEYEVR